jgi:SAM-dependent methyltransferase
VQDDQGLKHFLGVPSVYRLFQDLVGADYGKNWFIRECLCAKPNDKLIDIGCGTADILEQLPDVRYTGIDISERYIAAARRRHGQNGLFLQGTTETYRADPRLENSDLVTCIGLLHHLDDRETLQVLGFAREKLRPGGRFVCVEPCLLRHQTAASRWIMSKDRGRNVRLGEEWRRLLETEFASCAVHVVTGLLRLPYVHAVLEGWK